MLMFEAFGKVVVCSWISCCIKKFDSSVIVSDGAPLASRFLLTLRFHLPHIHCWNRQFGALPGLIATLN